MTRLYPVWNITTGKFFTGGKWGTWAKVGKFYQRRGNASRAVGWARRYSCDDIEVKAYDVFPVEAPE